MLHRFPDDSEFTPRQLAELSSSASSRAAATTLAETYVGTAAAVVGGTSFGKQAVDARPGCS